MEVDFPKQLSYPAVTVCGLSKISCRRLSRAASKFARAVGGQVPEEIWADAYSREELEDVGHRLCKLQVLSECDGAGGGEGFVDGYEDRVRAAELCARLEEERGVVGIGLGR